MTTADIPFESMLAPPVDALDTVSGSVLHRLARWAGRVSFVRVYACGVLVTYVPLFVAAVLSPFPLLVPAGSLRLPFLRDWNVAFMFLASFPTILALTLTDDGLVRAALERLRHEGTLAISDESMAALRSVWQRRFARVNRAAYTAGVAAGLIVAACDYIAYTPPAVGFWISSQNKLNLAGYVFLYCIFLFYALVPIYVLRSVAIARFLRDVVSHAELHMLPFHPDKCGGLRPIGRLGLRNQYALTVIGLNVVLLAVVSVAYLHMPVLLYYLIGAAAIAYFVLGPVVFLGPLLSFRAGMLRTKNELMSDVAKRLRRELERLRRELPSGTISGEDEELIARLRRVGAVIDELPVWPFDAGTLRKFLTAYVLPMMGAIGYPLLGKVVEKTGAWLFH